MSLLITGADGRPINQGFVEIRLDAPKPGRFFSTDFPFIEGSRLSEMRLALRQGRATWNYLLPIRGEYRLAVDVVTLDGKKASKIFDFRVRENEQKWFILGAFSVGLFLLGVSSRTRRGKNFHPKSIQCSFIDHGHMAFRIGAT